MKHDVFNEHRQGYGECRYSDMSVATAAACMQCKCFHNIKVDLV
jgi:hypothetical protein